MARPADVLNTRHKILGWCETVTACDCCGKSGLKGTFACETAEGDEVYYGSTCVKRNTGILKPNEAAAKYRKERKAIAASALRNTPEYKAYRDAMNHPARQKLIGRAAAEFVRVEAAAFDAKRAEIAAAYHLSPLEIPT